MAGVGEKPAHLSWESTEPVNERRDEMRWLAKESGLYAGEWVALEGPGLVAHGPRLSDVRAAAKAAGAPDPLIARVPGDTTPFGGW